MKNTGIVRRIDDLGRIVIPKELRRTLGLKEDDAMEFYVSDGNFLTLHKYETSSSQFYEMLKVHINDVYRVLEEAVLKVECVLFIEGNELQCVRTKQGIVQNCSRLQFPLDDKLKSSLLSFPVGEISWCLAEALNFRPLLSSAKASISSMPNDFIVSDYCISHLYVKGMPNFLIVGYKLDTSKKITVKAQVDAITSVVKMASRTIEACHFVLQ